MFLNSYPRVLNDHADSSHQGSFRVLGDQGWKSFTLVIMSGDAPTQGRPRVCLPHLSGNLTPK